MATEPGLGKALRLARVAAGLSQIDAAARLRKSRQTLNAYEREGGGPNPDADTLTRLAGVYGTTVEAIRRQASASHGTPAATPGALPPLEPQWASSPVFWAGAQWATAGLSDRLAEIQRAVLAHLGQLTRPAAGAAADDGEPLPPRVYGRQIDPAAYVRGTTEERRAAEREAQAARRKKRG